jgi:hypothetical protein
VACRWSAGAGVPEADCRVEAPGYEDRASIDLPKGHTFHAVVGASFGYAQGRLKFGISLALSTAFLSSRDSTFTRLKKCSGLNALCQPFSII